MTLTHITFLELNVPRISFLSGFSSTAFPLVNPQMDVREGPEFRPKIDERKRLLCISLRSGNADWSERMGAVAVIVFKWTQFDQTYERWHGGEGNPCGRPRHTSSMMTLLIHYHETIWRSFTVTRMEQSIAYSKVTSNLCYQCIAGFHSLEIFLSANRSPIVQGQPNHAVNNNC
jgi:hypothetical protein